MPSKFRLILLPLLALTFLLLTPGCGDELPPDQTSNYEEDVKPLIETDEKATVRGSCNFINEQSVCVDFVGSLFTEERMKLSCTEGTFSLDSCPYSDLGGCQATPGTVSESIAWSYDYGGSPISVEEAGYQAQACNAMDIGKWVLPEDLLQTN
ncbi:MAG: hypothetical protein WC882_02025 [Candidatus Gracilibacteria bacterium]